MEFSRLVRGGLIVWYDVAFTSSGSAVRIWKLLSCFNIASPAATDGQLVAAVAQATGKNM